MKKWLAVLLTLLLPFSFAAAEGINPFLEVPVQITVSAEIPDQMVSFTGIDFGDGAAQLRLKASTDDELVIRVYADSMEGSPIATAEFQASAREYRGTVSLSGVHDLYFKLEGNGLFASWQAFAPQAGIDGALRDTLPSDYTGACANGGTIEKFVYRAHDVFNDNAVYEKTAFVYLPWGYDAAKTYDLLILCHGIGGNEYEWGMTDEESRVKRVMDNLIDRGEIRPFIVVTPDGRAGKTEDYSSFYRFDEELRNDLLPALAERYAVDVRDRNRCAMAGLSMGGMQTVNLGIGKCLDIFSAFGAFSACPTTNAASETAAVLNGSEDLPVRVFYSICGTEDNIALSSAIAAAEGLDAMTDRLNEKNFFVQYVPGGHDFDVWYLGFYNFARMIGGARE